jgi:hypothetical protein
MLPNYLRPVRTEIPAAKSLVLTELEAFLGKQSAEVQASLLAFVHLIEPGSGGTVSLDIKTTGELSLALSGRERDGSSCTDD